MRGWHAVVYATVYDATFEQLFRILVTNNIKYELFKSETNL